MQQRYVEPEERKQNLSPQSTQRLYTPETVHRAVELAAEMQVKQTEMLTNAEIEAIASEAGIEPQFIQRALTIAETEVNQQKVFTRATKRHAKGSRRFKTLTIGVPLAYFLANLLLTLPLRACYELNPCRCDASKPLALALTNIKPTNTTKCRPANVAGNRS